MAKLYAKAPDGSDALLSIVITGFTQSLQQNGWCKLPNGLLFQWSQAYATPSNSNDRYFPPPLETTALSIQAIHSGRDGNVNIINSNRGENWNITYYFKTNWTEFPNGIQIFYLLIGY